MIFKILLISCFAILLGLFYEITLLLDSIKDEIKKLNYMFDTWFEKYSKTKINVNINKENE